MITYSLDYLVIGMCNNLDEPFPKFPARSFKYDYKEEEVVSLGDFKSFTFKELQHATDNFSCKNILGVEGFGNVYQGKLGMAQWW
ncbi:putative LRR receptor-like serine/threonine-protein [Sesbania bispinosa]|nr:putative LRR receptor-like serine/threonine-protein [Sesbania bispinosa]